MSRNQRASRRKLAIRRETLRALTLSQAALERAGGGTGWQVSHDCEHTLDCNTLGTGSKYCPQM